MSLRQYSILLVFCVLVSSLKADWACDGYDKPYLDYEFGAGYRQDKLNWSTSPYGKQQLLSELSWKDLHIAQLYFSTTFICYGAYIRSYCDFGWLMSGKNQGAVFDDPEEHKLSSHETKQGDVWDISGGIGYQFVLNRQNITFPPYYEQQPLLTVAPLVGYSLHVQNLHMSNGEKSIHPHRASKSNVFKGLSGKYNTNWNGPWVGVDTSFYFTPTLSVFGEFEYHWVTFEACGRWDFRKNFVGKFHQKAEGRGANSTVGLRWDYCDSWSFALWGNYQVWRADDGHEIARLNPHKHPHGDKNKRVRMQLNHVHWDSYSVTSSVQFVF
jgi:hypothetical protein